MNEKLLPARIGKSLARGFRCAYDNAGYVLGISLLTFCVCALLFFCATKLTNNVFRFAVSIGGIYITWLLWCGAFYWAHAAVSYKYPVFSDTFFGIKRLFGYASMLFCCDAIITAILVGDLYAFYKLGGAYIYLEWFFIYLLFMWMLMMMYHLPLLPAQLELESKPTPAVIIKKSFLLVMDNFVFTLVYFLVIITVIVFCAIPALVGFAIMCPGLCAFILSHGLRELFIKYKIIEDEPDTIIDTWTVEDINKNKDGSNNA